MMINLIFKIEPEEFNSKTIPTCQDLLLNILLNFIATFKDTLVKTTINYLTRF